ncbi:MAG: hypothetical protein GX248_01175 [Peptococcaceae bacterium]|jgi:hypothetical protein|nr:hypothetical protein [Peptococcaceae bacterium]
MGNLFSRFHPQFKYLVAILLSLVIILSGCSLVDKMLGNSPEQTEQAKQEEKAEKVPKQLEELDLTLEKVFKNLGGPTAVASQEQQQGNSKNQSTQNQKQQQADNNSPQSQNGRQTEQNAQSSDPWQQAASDIESLHSAWNDYMPEITQKGASKELLDKFSDALNNLTKAVETKDKNKTMLAANNLYAGIAEMYALYKIKTVPGLKLLIYHTRNVILNSAIENWSDTNTARDDLKAAWSLVRTTLEGQKDGEVKLDLSINELDKVIKEKNIDLIEIKGKLILANIESLQKSLKEASK